MTAKKQQTPLQKTEEEQILRDVNEFFDGMPPNDCISALSQLIEVYCVHGDEHSQGSPVHFAASLSGLIARIDRQRDLAGISSNE